MTELNVRASAALRVDRPLRIDEFEMPQPRFTRRTFVVELLPHERRVLQKWNLTPEIQSQLKPLAASEDVETIKLTVVDMTYLVSDLNHAIVKRGAYNDEDTIELCERLERVEKTGNGKLDDWYG